MCMLVPLVSVTSPGSTVTRRRGILMHSSPVRDVPTPLPASSGDMGGPIPVMVVLLLMGSQLLLL